VAVASRGEQHPARVWSPWRLCVVSVYVILYDSKKRWEPIILSTSSRSRAQTSILKLQLLPLLLCTSCAWTDQSDVCFGGYYL
jgi:hypothetical protein